MSKLRIAVGLAVVGAVLGVFSGTVLYLESADPAAERLALSKVDFRSSTNPALGGPFSLIDHTGKAVTDMDFRGKFMLVFFGYTFCPDICPTELQVIADSLDILGESGAVVQPLFITVDPERDTPEELADYVAAFHPRLLGLTGSAEQIAAAAAVYKASYVKLEDPGSGEDASYFMGHSSSTYLVGPGGRVLYTFPRGVGPVELAREVGNFLPAPPGKTS